jgi:hypothetical protein
MKNKIILCLYIIICASPVFAQCLLPVSCGNGIDTLCDVSDNEYLFWNGPLFLDVVHNNSRDLCEGEVNLDISVVDTCNPAGIKIAYTLFLDLNGDGITETFVNSDNLPAAGTLLYGNTFSPGISTRFDNRAVANKNLYAFALQKVVTGNTVKATLMWTVPSISGSYVVPQLPAGKHRIQWIINSNGQKDTCVRNFVIRDCKKPDIKCLNGLSVNLMNTKLITLYASDFLLSNTDNCTPANLLPTAIRKATDSTPGFPLDSLGKPITNVTFSCNEIGKQYVKIWSKDGSGNTSFCQTYVLVYDENDYCSLPNNNLRICILVGPNYTTYYSPNGVQDGNVVFERAGFGGVPSYSFVKYPIKFGSCEYEKPKLSPFSFFGSSFLTTTVRPQLDDNPLNGVSTYDLQLLKNYILYDSIIKGPYRFIAADIDANGVINQKDADELQDLILGIYIELPHNKSWRFVPRTYQFPDPTHPFSPPFPEKVALNILNIQTGIEFVGIKIGNISSAGYFSNAVTTNDRTPTYLHITDQLLEKGAVVEVPVYADGLQKWKGFQAGLQGDRHLLAIETVEPGGLPEMSARNIAQFGNSVRTSWSHALAQNIEPDQPLFTLRVRALETVRLSEALQLEENQFVAEAYDDQDNARLPLNLEFRAETGKHTNDAVVTLVRPNPTSAGAVLSLQLTESEQVQCALYDAAGRLCYQTSQWMEAGQNNLELPAVAMPSAGVYTWKIQAGKTTQIGKIIRS